MFFTAEGLRQLAGFESSGNPTAQSATSTASGLYGFTNPTWREFAPQAGVNLSQYPTAASAPADIQTSVAAITPTSHWTCPGCDANANLLVTDPSMVSVVPIASQSDVTAANSGGDGSSMQTSGIDLGSNQTNYNYFGLSPIDPNANTPNAQDPLVNATGELPSGLGNVSDYSYFGLTPPETSLSGGTLGNYLDSFGNAQNYITNQTAGNTYGLNFNPASVTDFWTKLFAKIENVGARFGLIFLGVIVIGVGAYAATQGEFGSGIQKLAKGGA